MHTMESSAKSEVVAPPFSMSDRPIAVNENGGAGESVPSLFLSVAGQTDARELPARVGREEIAIGRSQVAERA